jgi:hypothetical protein
MNIYQNEDSAISCDEVCLFGKNVVLACFRQIIAMTEDLPDAYLAHASCLAYKEYRPLYQVDSAL